MASHTIHIIIINIAILDGIVGNRDATSSLIHLLVIHIFLVTQHVSFFSLRRKPPCVQVKDFTDSNCFFARLDPQTRAVEERSNGIGIC